MKTQIDVMSKIADKAYQLFESGETKESLLKKLREAKIDTDDERVVAAINTAWSSYKVANASSTGDTCLEQKKKGKKYYFRIRNVTGWLTELNMDLYFCNFGFYDFQEIIYENNEPVAIWKQSNTGHRIIEKEMIP